MAYSTATAAQQAQVQDFSLQCRAYAIAWTKLIQTGLVLQTAWNANVLGILGSPQGTPIPDGTGLAGAVEMTDTQLTNLYGTFIANVLSGYNTAANQNALMLATGPDSVM